VRWRHFAAPALLLLAACAGGERRGARGARGAAEGEPSGDAAAATPANDRRPAILIVGTSLTAGLGVGADSAYPAVLQRRIDRLGLGWRVINAGVSGETSAGAERRMSWLLQGPIRIVVVETGANDGLRGLDVDSTRANLEAIFAEIRAYDPAIRLVLAGMEAPPNMGPRFTARFRALFPELARREHAALIPFLLAGVAGIDSLNQADGIHPTAQGHRLVADNVWRVLAPMLEDTTRTREALPQ